MAPAKNLGLACEQGGQPIHRVGVRLPPRSRLAQFLAGETNRLDQRALKSNAILEYLSPMVDIGPQTLQNICLIMN